MVSVENMGNVLTTSVVYMYSVLVNVLQVRGIMTIVGNSNVYIEKMKK